MRAICLLVTWSCCGALASAQQQRISLGEGDPREVRIYAVGGLAATHGVLPAEPGEGKTAANADSTQSLDPLARFVRKFVRPPLKSNEDVKPLGAEHLVLLGRASQQTWMAELLQRNKAAGKYLVRVHTQYLEFGKAVLETHFEPLAKQHKSPKNSVVLADDAPSRLWKKNMLAATGVTVKKSLAATVVPMHRLNVSKTESTEFVKDFEIVSSATEPMATRKIMGTVKHGDVLMATSAMLGDGRVGLDLNYLHLDLTRPVPTFETRMPNGLKIKLDLPETTLLRFKQQFIVANKALIVMWFQSGKRNGALLVQVKVMR